MLSNLQRNLYEYSRSLNLQRNLYEYCRSLNAKIDELQVVAQQNHVDVIAVTETWLNPEIPDGPVSLTDFSIVRNDRASGKRGEASAHSLRYTLLHPH